jgi:hypothetical protein
MAIAIVMPPRPTAKSVIRSRVESRLSRFVCSDVVTQVR